MDEKIDYLKEIQNKEEEISNIKKEKQYFDESMFNFTDEIKKAKEETEYIRSSSDILDDYNNKKSFEDDFSFLEGITKDLEKAKDEMEEEYNKQINKMNDEVEELYRKKNGDDENGK
ncbi:MAG: hypothetical protein LBM02_09650 [Lachnospiraceae bacterium]|jgi:hypothetical protein|nr:hypothetical protein [Lachnospiraceae bacterium]